MYIGKILLVNTECADIVRGAPRDRIAQRTGVVQREPVEQDARAARNRDSKYRAVVVRNLIRLLEKRATQPEPDHGEAWAPVLSSRSCEWPAPRERLDAARRLLTELTDRRGRVIIAPHGDADGLAAGALAIRAVERMGGTPIAVPAGQGRARAQRRPCANDSVQFAADGLMVLDMGSRQRTDRPRSSRRS